MAAKKLSEMDWQIHVGNQGGTLDGRQERTRYGGFGACGPYFCPDLHCDVMLTDLVSSVILTSSLTSARKSHDRRLHGCLVIFEKMLPKQYGTLH
jgi:hypothetical protein